MSSAVVRGSCHRNPEQEIVDLKRKLCEMSELCLQLQEQFQLMETKVRISEMQSKASHLEEAPTNDYDSASLREKMRELVMMNVNWQKHSVRQEKVIGEQDERIARLERQLAARGSGQLPESQQVEFDRLLLAKKHECSALEEEKERTADENHHLQLRLDEVEKTLADHKERCGLLEAQLVMYLEDFKTERSDRERAQSRIIELEAKLTEKSANEVVFPVQATSGYNPYEAFNHHPSPYTMPLRGRGIYQTDGDTCDGFPNSPSTVQMKKTPGRQRDSAVFPAMPAYQADGFDETDNSHVLDLSEDLPGHHISLGDVLSCPKCRKAFTRDRHLELLEHMEECD